MEILKITEEDIRKGIDNGKIDFIIDPNMGTRTVCSIGETWFYFGGCTADDMNPSEYLKVADIQETINNIYDALQDISEYNRTEFLYIYYTLIEP